VDAGKYERVFDFSTLEIRKEKRSLRIICDEIEEISTAYLSNILWLKESILDRQIVDINGKKLEKVKDIRLVDIPSGAYAISVVTGLEGWLRRKGLLDVVNRFLLLFGKDVPGRQILWDDIESVDVDTARLFLAKTNSRLSRLHPSDLADIIEDLDKTTRTYVVSNLDEEHAADVLEELEPDAQVDIIKRLPLSKAADLLEKMPADEAADILDELSEQKAELLLREMNRETSDEVRELLEYDDKEIGSIMNTDFYAFTPDRTIGEILSQLRHDQPEPYFINTLFIVDKKKKFISAVTLAELILRDPQLMIGKVAPETVVTVRDTDKIKALAEMVTKYGLLSVPVLNDSDEMEGMVLIEDVIENMIEHRKQ
jgi:CBS domain-containing protein/sporulation protein YlmC with PRC-barrel domain